MKTVLLTSLLSLFLGISTGCTQAVKVEDKSPKAEAPKEEKKETKQTVTTNEVAVIKTAYGDMVLEFWSDVAPKTVENFKTLAKKGFFDGTAFHRIIDGFMIQGGDPNTKDASKEALWGRGDPGYKIKGETNNRSDRKHVRGVISMANSGSPDTAGSQFFICLGPTPSLDGGYTTFGKVIKGDDVLEKLGKAAVKPNPYDPRHELSRPVERQGVESIKIVPADEVKKQ
ncbi:MAG TPA: peptidylprolyl isomerase [Candidatus Saccharimonadales bacterium]|nr:peptidylprolyl isomerase [Candidatus Saccharimonadales bacterium]